MVASVTDDGSPVVLPQSEGTILIQSGGGTSVGASADILAKPLYPAPVVTTIDPALNKPVPKVILQPVLQPTITYTDPSLSAQPGINVPEKDNIQVPAIVEAIAGTAGTIVEQLSASKDQKAKAVDLSGNTVSGHIYIGLGIAAVALLILLIKR
jgi:hypothetical protein